MIFAAGAGVVVVTSVLLFLFGVNLLFLTWRAARLRPARRPAMPRGGEPLVCVQVPIYNERYVAERVIDAVCDLEWPQGRLQVQLLDDSDDDTTDIVGRIAQRRRATGLRIDHVRRGTRSGFKAGALAYGLTVTDAPFIAIFDADFVPPADFLRRIMGVFDDSGVAFAQARWGHLDEGYSWFTRLQALAIDFHFLVEQSVRSASGYFTNFTGTAGVWRRAAIDDAGGWSDATLTEDLDLSYRAQLRGWKAAYLEDLVVPEELPVSIDAYRRQQSRWATGSFQSAFTLIGPVLLSHNRAAVKVQATAHLLAYGVGPVMLVQLACYPVLLAAFALHGLRLPWYLVEASVAAIFVGISPWIGFMVAQTRRGRRWWSGFPSFLCQVVGAGMSVNTMISLFGATRRGGAFVRTPKYSIVERGQEWRDQAYVRVGDPRAIVESAFGLAALSMVPVAIALSEPLLALYAGMFALGFLTVAALSAADLFHVLTLRSLGRRAMKRLQAIAPALALAALAGSLLLVAAQMPEPFEDGYAHWLIAANVAATGHLHDPIFGMEDTWLPGYHVLAALMLRVFGLWQLGALKAMGAMLGLATVACVYSLAPNVRQGRIAAVMLLLNPVFLFTSGSAVVEPLLTSLLTGAGLAAARGRMKVAVALATAACLTSTKAWIWVGAAAAFALVAVLRSRGPVRRRIPALPGPASSRGALRVRGTFAWAVPAVALLVFLQLGFAPASHSVARGSLELVSATGRGSVAAGALARLLELVGTYGLAALPLFAFGLVGMVMVVRQKTSPLVRFVYLPAIVYLAAVFGLVAGGAYTGSHRYLYPVLPALALLAAAALDRQAGVVRVLAVAAAGLLAVAFIPVFAGFAAENAGLVAAGKAASAAPGMLVTDSPVVAFYSGKAPSQITGSQSLPLDRAQAVEWLSVHGVTELVVEDISYYRATSLFPDLAAGRATAPFESLGRQSQYNQAGGKAVYAYRFGAALAMQSIFPGVDASLAAPPAEGKTAPLAKGMTLRVGNQAVAGEGMGFGVPIVHYADGWVYSRTSATVDASTASQATWARTFELDEIGGDAAHRYQFAPIASRGEIEVTYTVDATGISIQVRPLWLAPGFSEVGILNEESAAFDDFAAAGQRTLVGPAFGSWVPVSGPWARLQSKDLGVQWSLPPISGAALYGGRELVTPGFDWAGLDYIFPASFAGASYHVSVKEAT
ncbi:MAG TPA: glycosyltransferase [Candidatus Baltobacterales bacterium]|nr:glycosyltransferase [Candidatus Baltobacterales bacterium]